MTTFDLVIQNGTILTMDPENRVIENGSLCVSGDTISHVGDQTPESHDALKTIDAKGGLILPGLINGHTHAAMSLFKGLADDLPLMEWLNHYIFPVEKNMDADFIHTGTLLACAEMILSGTTTFCDMYLFEDQVAQAAFQSGLRCLVGEVLYDFPSPNYGDLENGFFKKGLRLVVDGREADVVRGILEAEIDAMQARHKLGAGLIDKMGVYAPAFGMLGTIIGLIQMLQTMDDPSTIGPSMATALVTTFYGLLVANVVFIPLAGKLVIRASEESAYMEMLLSGFLGLLSGDDPHVLKERIMAMLRPQDRQEDEAARSWRS